jgi:hypothetical protein
MLREIDEAMLNRFERFSHWTQRAFGWSSGYWAKTVTVVTVVSYSVDVVANYHWLKSVLVVWVIGASLTTWWRWADKEVMVGEAAFRHWSVDALWWLRLCLLVACVLPIASLSLDFSDLGCCATFSFFYFLAVTDLPQSPSRLRQWLDSFGDTGQPAEVV